MGRVEKTFGKLTGNFSNFMETTVPQYQETTNYKHKQYEENSTKVNCNQITLKQ